MSTIGTTTGSTTAETIDIRLLGACADRKARVLAAFDALAPGAGLFVVNDHMPNGLRAHLEALRPGAFEWRVLEAGPVLFRVEIARVA
jgi:uncharacterized protein (DUF2249 family)